MHSAFSRQHLSWAWQSGHQEPQVNGSLEPHVQSSGLRSQLLTIQVVVPQAPLGLGSTKTAKGMDGPYEEG